MDRADILDFLDGLERAIERTLEFNIPTEEEGFTSIAVGPKKLALPRNSLNVISMENARRAILDMKEQWKNS